jgi:hypothetical protein
MSLSGSYCYAQAFIEDDGQIDWMGDGVLCQLVTVMLIDDRMELEPAVGVLTAQQARDLAFQLLAAAEHAERLTRHRPEDQR